MGRHAHVFDGGEAVSRGDGLDTADQADGARVGQVAHDDPDDARAAAAVLGRQGYRPVRIRQRGVLDAWQSAVPWGSNRINRREILILFRELAALLRAGIPLASSLQGAIQQTETLALRQVLSDIARRGIARTGTTNGLARRRKAG